MFGPETGRLGEQHDADAAGNRPPIGIQADKLTLGRYVQSITDSRTRLSIVTPFEAALHHIQALLEAVGEGVSHCPKFDRSAGADRLIGCTGPARAATDESDFY